MYRKSNFWTWESMCTWPFRWNSVQTHRLVILPVQAWEYWQMDRQTDIRMRASSVGRIDRQTDANKCIISPALQSITTLWTRCSWPLNQNSSPWLWSWSHANFITIKQKFLKVSCNPTSRLTFAEVIASPCGAYGFYKCADFYGSDFSDAERYR